MVVTDERENLSLPQKRNSSPVYAEAHEYKKQEDYSFVAEERDRSQSPEYTEVANSNKHSRYMITTKANISYNMLQVSKINNTTAQQHQITAMMNRVGAPHTTIQLEHQLHHIIKAIYRTMTLN